MSSALQAKSMQTLHCSICESPGVDVCFVSCSCKAHAPCVPVNVILSEEALKQGKKCPVAPGEKICPACKTTPITSIQLLPLELSDLDKAVEIRRQVCTKDDCVKLRFDGALAEASYLLLSHAGSTGKLSSINDYQRTGRWTDEERLYTDFLISAFDLGHLPIEPGIKLGEFLGEMLLCKNSRLTKKMKYAKLSVRAYDFPHPLTTMDAKNLSTLEQNFLDSVPSEHLRLELRFHLTRVWRAHLSSLCLKLDSKLLDFTNWFKSLEAMEQRAIEAEEIFRKTRRERMNTMLRMDSTGMSKRSVSSAPNRRNVPPLKRTKVCPSSSDEPRASSSVTDTSSNEDIEDHDFVAEILKFENQNQPGDDDYAKILDELASGSLPNGTAATRTEFSSHKNSKQTEPSSYLQDISCFLESSGMPFEHVDLWTPSITQDNNTDRSSLIYAGSVTRTDFAVFQRFGEQSSGFSFAPGVGLPGRAFKNTNYWAESLNEVDPRLYESSALDTSYGIESGIGIRLSYDGTIVVVCFYSTKKLQDDASVIKKCTEHLSKLRPVVKWTPSIEIAPSGGLELVSTIDERSITSATTDASHSIEKDKVDHKIASLLGDHMPLEPLAYQVTPESSKLVPCFMSLRLLLLRSHTKRTAEDNEIIDVIRKSYVGYCHDARRTDKEVAHLIVKDWQFLRSSIPSSPSTDPTPAIIQSHKSFELPKLNLTRAGIPMKMPSLMTLGDPDFACRGN